MLILLKFLKWWSDLWDFELFFFFLSSLAILNTALIANNNNEEQNLQIIQLILGKIQPEGRFVFQREKKKQQLNYAFSLLGWLEAIQVPQVL